jgi:hypothetical protein
MPMVGIFMAVWVGVTGSVGMRVFVLVEDDLQPASKRIGDTAERSEARDMVAAFQSRNHGFRHREPRGELLLGLAGMGAKLEQAVGALRSNFAAVVERRPPNGPSVGLRHI